MLASGHKNHVSYCSLCFCCFALLDVQLTDPGTASIELFPRDRLASKQTPFGTLSYTYDDGGNLLTMRSSNTNGVSVDYSYDELNRLSTLLHYSCCVSRRA